MNDQVKSVIDKIDMAIGKCNSIINGTFDKCLEFLKSKGDTILGAVERFASRFGVFALLVCGALYTILCLKNMVLSFFFRDAPAKLCFALAVGSVIALMICAYAASKMLDALAKVIGSSTCKISSLNIFSVMTAVGLLMVIGSLIGGIYLAIEFKAFQPFASGLGSAAFFALMTLYTANPEKFGIVADEKASAGEDFVTLATFGLKIMLRLVPIALLGMAIVGILQIVPQIFSTYIYRDGNTIRLMVGAMSGEMMGSMHFVFIGIMPLVAYLVYIFYYVVLDLIRAVLQLPGKLDDLKK